MITEAPDVEKMAADAKALKEEGNAFFKAGKFDDALACYTKVRASRACSICRPDKQEFRPEGL